MRFLIAVFGIVGLTRPTFAQDRTLLGRISPGEDAVKVIEKAGCDPLWISQILWDSNIDPADMKYLTAGMKLYIRGSCKARPPESVAARSRRMLGLDRPVEKKVAEVKAPESPDTTHWIHLRDTLANSRAEISAMRDSVVRLAANRDSLRQVAGDGDSLKSENSRLKGELLRREAQSVGRPIRVIWSYTLLAGTFLLGLSLGSLVAYLYVRRRRDARKDRVILDVDPKMD